MADRYKGKFTAKQLKFIEAYKGNGMEAAREAGYSGDNGDLAVVGTRLLKNPNICKAIKERQAKEVKPLIASRHDRQKFLTDVFQDTKNSMKDRLKAVELLSKTEGDFIENRKVELSGNITTQQQVLVYVPDNGRKPESKQEEQTIETEPVKEDNDGNH